MKAILEFFNASWLELVGYTLLHSVWQGMLITISVTVLLRTIPTRLSKIRYGIATVGLLLVVVCSVVTFLTLSSGSPNDTSISGSDEFYSFTSVTLVDSSVALVPLVGSAQIVIEKFMPLFLMVWVIGAGVFLLRIFIGLAYVDRLRQGAVPVLNEWKDYVEKISTRLKIKRLIILAESSAIDAPVVIGYIKPLILIPIGLLSNLSTEQLETIFIHELMHIRRRDYLVNLLQSFVEAIFFFNPFVWAISSMVRSEREHCCDDAVLDHHGNASAYATALAALEEARLSRTALSLSLMGSKNELLKRIKRLMEKSTHPHYSSGKIIPAVLLVVGLACASWISTTTGPSSQDADYSYNAIVVQDTTKKNKKTKPAKRQQKNRASAPDNEVELNEQVDVDKKIEVEENVEQEVDESFSYAPPIPDFDLPPMPDVAGMMPPMVLLKEFEAPHLDWNDHDWEEFSQQFEEKFRSRFGDFYDKNEKDIQKMMDEIQHNLTDKLGKDFEVKMHDFAQRQEEWAKAHAEKFAQHAEQMALQGDRFERLGEDLHNMSENFHEEFEKHHREFEKQHKAFEEKSRKFENILREELIKDGYLDEGEKLEAIQFYNGALKVNGEPIKPEHEEKYNQLREKYFGTPGDVLKTD
jgi:beta-lactamase regulating signal transducer with metallopeptidase domain